MKRQSTLIDFTLVLVFILGTFSSISQTRFETQLGGANFLGISLNSAYDIPLSKSGKHILTPTIGFGHLSESFNSSTIILLTGIKYRYKRFGIGIEISHFKDNILSSDLVESDFIDKILYPNLNYTLFFRKHLYFSISGGIYFAYSRISYGITTSDQWTYEGDPIPGAGMTAGYRF